MQKRYSKKRLRLSHHQQKINTYISPHQKKHASKKHITKKPHRQKLHRAVFARRVLATARNYHLWLRPKKYMVHIHLKMAGTGTYGSSLKVRESINRWVWPQYESESFDTGAISSLIYVTVPSRSVAICSLTLDTSFLIKYPPPVSYTHLTLPTIYSV